jgi:hypothetical protein
LSGNCHGPSGAGPIVLVRLWHFEKFIFEQKETKATKVKEDSEREIVCLVKVERE